MTSLPNPNLPESGFVFAPKGLRLEAQGCRFGYPGNKVIRASNREAVATGSSSRIADATALRLRTVSCFGPRVAEAATLGFEPQPLRGKAKLSESSMSLPVQRIPVMNRASFSAWLSLISRRVGVGSCQSILPQKRRSPSVCVRQ